MENVISCEQVSCYCKACGCDITKHIHIGGTIDQVAKNIQSETEKLAFQHEQLHKKAEVADDLIKALDKIRGVLENEES